MKNSEALAKLRGKPVKVKAPNLANEINLEHQAFKESVQQGN